MIVRADDAFAKIGEADKRPIARRRSIRRPIALRRRSFLRGLLTGATGALLGAQLSGCAGPSSDRANTSPTPGLAASRAGSPVRTAPAGGAAASLVETAPAGRRVLLAYFSRAGENYYYGGRTQLAVGNTEVVAGLITRLIGCDVYRIEAAEPYPADYEATVARNVREQQANARPAIANLPAALAGYDTVLLGSPIWNVRPPLIMATFAERFDFANKALLPFVTYAVSGLGTAARDYAAWCPGATIGEGLAVRGEEVGASGAAVEAWLRRIGLLKS